MTMRHLVRPEGMPPANGYSHAVVASGPLIAISGQVPVDAPGQAGSLVQVSVLVHPGSGWRSTP
ncbi:hypothetical protein ACFUNF_20895 [Streptomyces sp. NPDC057291]|uniref:hypothetical protein n=1 Tax=Streptomyces sp. NPDC057291 TaxID=3346087 RepID=UPI00362504EB